MKTITLVCVLLLLATDFYAQNNRPVFTIEGASTKKLGTSIAPLGDVNGDGFDDYALGQRGTVYVYYGQKDKDSIADWTTNLGTYVSGAGDVNGDGFNDVLIGNEGYSVGGDVKGRVLVFLGASTGLSTSSSWSYVSDFSSSFFGRSLSSAGDINGDGYDDIVLGAQGCDSSKTDAGIALVFHGSSTGLSSAPNWHYYPNNYAAGFGAAVSSAGDVNNDGYDDVLIGAPNWSAKSIYGNYLNQGAAFLFMGSASGLQNTAAWMDTMSSPNSKFGLKLSSAGDINGDGYGDVVIAFPGAVHPHYTSGFHIYYGSSTGISSSNLGLPDLSFVKPMFLGSDVSTGDINGDGYSDVLVTSAPHFQNHNGYAMVFYGTQNGLDTSLNARTSFSSTLNYDHNFGSVMSCIGDPNGDGYDDFAVAAIGIADIWAGKVFVYGGSSNGVLSHPNLWGNFYMALLGDEKYDGFGGRTAISANGRIVAGSASSHSDETEDAGHVKVYQWHDAAQAWSMMGAPINGEDSFDHASAVALSSDGTVLALGAKDNNHSGYLDAGHARVFKYNRRLNAWEQLGQDLDGDSSFNYFGRALSLSANGNRIAVGGTHNDAGRHGNYNTGHVQIFELQNGQWTQLGTDLTGDRGSDYFGAAVQLAGNGEYVIVGAYNNSDGYLHSGRIKAYKYDQNAGDWVQIGSAIDGDNTWDYFGESVAISHKGRTIAVGAPLNDDAANKAGQVKVYTYNELSDSWNLLGSKLNGSNADDQFGGSVSLSADGRKLAVGARNYTHSSLGKVGRIQVFKYSNSNWIQLGSDYYGDDDGDRAGGVALSDDGSTLVYGSPGNDENGISAGKVFVEKVSEDGMVWEGDQNRSWGIQGNWTNNRLPTTLEDVIIPGSIDSFPKLVGDVTLNNLTIRDGASMDLNGKTLTVTGTFRYEGEDALNLGTGKLKFMGEHTQYIEGNIEADLIVENEHDVHLTTACHIPHIELVKGYLDLEDYTLKIDSSSSGSDSSYIRISGSGKLKASVGGTPVTLPIGRNPYLPIVIDNGGGAEYTVGLEQHTYANPEAQTTLQSSNVVGETWTVQASSAQTNVTVTLQWESAEEETGFNRGTAYLSYWEEGVNTSWDLGTSQSANGSGPYSLTRTVDFSTHKFYLGVGSAGSALPVELSHFAVQWLEPGTSVALNWATQSELNNSHFEIERSVDAQHWEQIATVEGNGTTVLGHSYQFRDHNLPLSKISTVYYRLKQVDFNGQSEYSPIKTLILKEGIESSFSLWPNPSNGDRIRLSEVGDYTLMDTRGAIYLQSRGVEELDISALPVGCYVVVSAKGNTQLLLRK